MNILKAGSYKWWQIGLLKLALLFVGIAIGANWPAIFLPYTIYLVVIAVLLGIYLGFAWIKNS